MFCALNRTLRGHRRRLVTLAAVLALAGAVVAVHSATNHDHMGDSIVLCLAVAETTVAAVGAALALGLWLRRPLQRLSVACAPAVAFIPSRIAVPARAGPRALQAVRL